MPPLKKDPIFTSAIEPVLMAEYILLPCYSYTCPTQGSFLYFHFIKVIHLISVTTETPSSTEF